MAIDAQIIAKTCEMIAGRIGDPTEAVFAELFRCYPHYEDMFVMDKGGLVRGSMMEACIKCLLSLAEGDQQTTALLLDASRLVHDGFGLEDGEIDRIFFIMRDVFRDVLAEDWSARMNREWTNLLTEITRVGH